MESIRESPPPDDLDELVGPDDGLSDDEYDHLILQAFHKMEAGIAAKKLRQLVRIYRAARRRGDDDVEWFADTVAIETGSSIAKVRNDLALGLRLTESLPHTLDLLAAGELDLYRVRKISDAAQTLTPEQSKVFEERIYPDVLGMTVRTLLRRVNRVVAELDPDAAEQRRVKSQADRHVWCEPEPHTGMGWLNAYLPGEDIAAINKHLDTLATSNNDGIRTMDQRRADTLRDLLLHRQADSEGDAGGVAATVYVTVSAETLLGLDQRAGDLRGYGPITAEHARELAYQLQSKWVGVLVDNNGRAVNMTCTGYRFRGRLAELIRLRDTTCTHPGCDRPADRCDIDHLIPWPHGQTTPANASTECRRHHRLKTLTDWTISRDHETVAWTKPDGKTLTKRIEPIAETDPPQKSAKPPEDDPPAF